MADRAPWVNLRAKTLARALAWLALASMLGACAGQAKRMHATTDEGSAAGQMVVVTSHGWDAAEGTLRTFERSDGNWVETGKATPVTIGRSGAAWGTGLNPAQDAGPRKREGDGRSPAGIFSIGPAFGYAPDVATALAYEAMQSSHYCIDVSGSRFYNRIVDAKQVGAKAVAGSTEPMRRDLHAGGDQRYRLGFVIEHNRTGEPMGGSCIFAHLWKSPTDATAGCTAMDAAAMDRLLKWLRTDAHPVFVLLPHDEYRRLQRQWALPVLEKE